MPYYYAKFDKNIKLEINRFKLTYDLMYITIKSMKILL